MLGRVIKVNLARPMKGPVQLGGNRAGGSFPSISVLISSTSFPFSMGVGGVATTKSETSGTQWRLAPVFSPFRNDYRYVYHVCPGNQARAVKQDTEEVEAQQDQQDEAMEE